LYDQCQAKLNDFDEAMLLKVGYNQRMFNYVATTVIWLHMFFSHSYRTVDYKAIMLYDTDPSVNLVVYLS